jgi:RNA polymerase sigma factor (sigma-70 family)
LIVDVSARRATARGHLLAYLRLMPDADSEEQRWFVEQLQPHEGMLRAWLRTQFPSATDLDDIVQDAFVRVLHARASTPIDSPKAFLFATARNLVLMQLRRGRIVNPLAEIVDSDILDESTDVRHAVDQAQELEILTRAIQSLPTRCRQIVTLRKIYGLSQKEVAAKLGISEHTVEAQGTIALRKLARFFERLERPRSLRHE